MKKKLLLGLGILAGFQSLHAQENQENWGTLHGNFQFDGQLYVRDKSIDPLGEFYPDERFLGQGFANFNYSHGNFRAGLRYENYQNVILGFPTGYTGEGITYRYLQFVKDGLDVTVGNFYEQFGSGMIFRAYEERGLGLDNVMDGVRLKYAPMKGLQLTGVIGKQRVYFDKAPGVVRGLDANMSLNEAIPAMAENKWRFTIGGSFVSKYQSANDPFYNLPENVGAGAGRLTVQRGGFIWNTEYVYKANDPSADNGNIFRDGQGLLSTLTYTQRGLGIIASFKRIDNMAFRSDRNGKEFEAFINYLPPTTKLHTYSLPALFPYATQINGEVGRQIQVSYKFDRSTLLGGKYGTLVTVNYADAYSLYKEEVEPGVPIGEAGTDGYKTDWFKQGQVHYYTDFDIEIRKKISREWKVIGTYYNFFYNKSVLEDGVADQVVMNNPNVQEIAFVNAGVVELIWNYRPQHSIRMELQGAFSDQYRGDMAMVLLEYGWSPHWFFSMQTIHNYGHTDPAQRLTYPIGSVTYYSGQTRIQMSYGRQQAGIFCVGGICRVVPPSNGLSLSVTTNF
ncbi:DUF6029 family protein [Phaeocystidibacter marisrubri]|uniref:Capsule assembly Wzi family protein n=1 Tax=Phaeocystidibacter marisrubri TaxID=1577780 RepID=A0A6L3ZGE2_9FLAO|nr:DUF6029 family protein [Phaeocystidibacter marisrubri]KAB2816924.1 hypothetical protein F8C82_00575 [Phaeocystidibacter marisrubri]GGH77573.1 hypothetical protein GCM10011318_27550 [Phaeocystidibacter marisrubri]